MSDISFKLSKVSSALTSKRLYRASVQSAGVAGHEELAANIAERTKIDARMIKYILDVLSDEIDEHLLDGCRVRLGRLQLGFAIRGTFANEDDEFDSKAHQLVATMRMFEPLKSKMAAEIPINVTAGLKCVLASAMDAVTKRISEINGTNKLCIQGKRLGISPVNIDEGVWLVDPKTDKIVATATVECSDSQTIDCVFPDPPVPGLYTLVVACRNGARESLAPAVAKIKNFVVKS